MTIRAVAFDAVGTVLHVDPSAALVYARVGARFGSRLLLEQIQARFRAAFLHEEELDWQAGLRTSEARERERWQRIVAATLYDVMDTEACFGELWQHFSTPQAWRLDLPLVNGLRQLAELDYPLLLASNFDGRLHTVCAGFPELACIRRVLVSSEVGWRKPAACFFEAVCQEASCSAEEMLFVGDNLENDVQGAQAAGLQAVLAAGLDVDGILAML